MASLTPGLTELDTFDPPRNVITDTDTDTDVELELTDRQARAVDLLASGMNDTDVAAAIGAHRSTVCKWRHSHAGVQAALARARVDAHRDRVDRLRRLQVAALEWAETELQRDGTHAHKVALTLLATMTREPDTDTELEPPPVIKVDFHMG